MPAPRVPRTEVSMGTHASGPANRPRLPGHNDLPDQDGVPVTHYTEPIQGRLLISALEPRLRVLHPDRRYLVARDMGIYWKFPQPPLLGCKSPDWYYVPDVEPTLLGSPRRSYVLWQEIRAPLLVIEYPCG